MRGGGGGAIDTATRHHTCTGRLPLLCLEALTESYHNSSRYGTKPRQCAGHLPEESLRCGLCLCRFALLHWRLVPLITITIIFVGSYHKTLYRVYRQPTAKVVSVAEGRDLLGLS